MHALYFLTSTGRKYILVEKQISISTCKYRSRKRSERFVIFKTATDRRSVKLQAYALTFYWKLTPSQMLLKDFRPQS